MGVSFLFGKFPAGRRITVNRSAPAHLNYQITATGRRQEKIEDEGRRSENGVMRIASDGRRPALTKNEPCPPLAAGTVHGPEKEFRSG
jgi:hypothetical protein